MPLAQAVTPPALNTNNPNKDPPINNNRISLYNNNRKTLMYRYINLIIKLIIINNKDKLILNNNSKLTLFSVPLPNNKIKNYNLLKDNNKDPLNLLLYNKEVLLVPTLPK